MRKIFIKQTKNKTKKSKKDRDHRTVTNIGIQQEVSSWFHEATLRIWEHFASKAHDE